MDVGPAGPSISEDAFRQPWTTDETLLVRMGYSVVTGSARLPGLGTCPHDDNALAIKR
jgi:hypothetical protein